MRMILPIDFVCGIQKHTHKTWGIQTKIIHCKISYIGPPKWKCSICQCQAVSWWFSSQTKIIVPLNNHHLLLFTIKYTIATLHCVLQVDIIIANWDLLVMVVHNGYERNSFTFLMHIYKFICKQLNIHFKNGMNQRQRLPNGTRGLRHEIFQSVLSAS